jgi:hypothetical protein
MRVTSTVDAYLGLAAIRDDNRRRAAWTENYEAAHRGIFETYYQGWGKRERSLEAAGDVPLLAPVVRDVEVRARSLVARTERAFRATGLLDDDLDVVLMVGGHTSNGWVTEYHGREVLFLALEFLGDPPYDEVLVSHEALHIAHDRLGAADWQEDCAASLFQEGIAVAITREFHPGLPESAYLWFDGDHEAWVAACAQTETKIATRALTELDTPQDDVLARALFTMQPEEPELPPRAGYWLGDLVVRRLLEQHPARELLGWDRPSARRALAHELRAVVNG